MDDYVRNVFNGEADKRDAVSLQKYRWQDRTIYYEFKPDIGNILRPKLHDTRLSLNPCYFIVNIRRINHVAFNGEKVIFHPVRSTIVRVVHAPCRNMWVCINLVYS